MKKLFFSPLISRLSFLFRMARALNPAPNVGGLEIREGSVRYLCLEAGGARRAALTLPQGIVADGAVKDAAALTSALKELHRRVKRNAHPLHAVLVLPSHAVAWVPLAVPAVPEEAMEETARANLAIASPYPSEETYSDYLFLGERYLGDEAQRGIAGMFARREAVDAYVAAARAAGFSPVAVEPPALGVIRALREEGVLGEKAVIMRRETPEGAELILARGGIVVMSRFFYWSETECGAGEGLDAETKRLMLYHQGTWGEAAELMAVPALPRYQDLAPQWFSALGAALRGRIPRGDDRLPTLALVGAAREYYQGLLLNFIVLWRNLFAVTAAALLVLFLASYLFLGRFAANLEEKSASILPQEARAEIDPLLAQAASWNALAEKAARASRAAHKPAFFFDAMRKIAAEQGITLMRVAFDSEQRGILAGRASSEEKILAFKQALGRDRRWSGVTLPLSSIKPSPDGTYSFSLTLVAQPQ